MVSISEILRNKIFWILLVMVLIMTSGVSCSIKDSPDTTSSKRATFTEKELETLVATIKVTREPEQVETTERTNETPATEFMTETPDYRIVLPEDGQIPPSEILSEIRWFDGGADGSWPFSPCQIGVQESSENIQVYQEAILYNERDELIEGEEIRICGLGFPSQAYVIWTLETPDGSSISETSIADNNGVSEFFPNFNHVYGQYEIRAEVDEIIYNEHFEILESDSPKVWVSGNFIPGNTITANYAGFDPNVEITTVWYTKNLYDIFRYLTHWKTRTDEIGRASETIDIPAEICLPQLSILAVQSHKFNGKRWEISGGSLDLPATAITTLSMEYDCPASNTEQLSSLDNQLNANSSSLLHQVYMGKINDGEVKAGSFASTFEAHNWNYEAIAWQHFIIQVLFPTIDFPNARISIIDPSERLVFECSDAIRGCSQISEGSFIEFTPEMSGSYSIRLDVFNEDIVEYSISVYSSP